MTDFLSKINQLDDQLNIEQVHHQVKEINDIISIVSQKQVFKKAPQKLGFLPDIAEEICASLSQTDIKHFRTINQLIDNLRQFLAINFGVWSLPNLQTAKAIKDCLNIKSGLEIMAGNAYWSKALSDVGVKMIVTDNLDWSKTSNTGSKSFMPVANFDAAQAVEIFDNVDLIICSWAPNFGNSDTKVVSTWQKLNTTSHLLFIGEKNGATNSEAFWQKGLVHHSKELKQINQTFPSFDFINEHIFEIAHEI